MCRLLGYCSRGEAALADLIGDEGLCDLTALSALHSDGWGMAWYDGGEPVIRKSPLRADDEPEYDKLARQCAAEGVDHTRYLLRLTELEMIDRERRTIERRIKDTTEKEVLELMIVGTRDKSRAELG